MNLLRDAVGFVEPVMPEPQARQQGLGMVGVLDRDGEQLGRLKPFQDRPRLGISRAFDHQAGVGVG
jgi:hypothetical protein